MIRCGRTGAALLYGTKCAGCDCQLARFHDGGTIPRGTVHMGFDLVSGPDHTAHVRVSDRYEYRVEDIEAARHPDLERFNSDLERFMRQKDEELLRAMGVPPEHFNCRSRMDPSGGRTYSAGPAGRSYIMEIITDPDDRRGMDARRVGPAL